MATPTALLRCAEGPVERAVEEGTQSRCPPQFKREGIQDPNESPHVVSYNTWFWPTLPGGVHYLDILRGNHFIWWFFPLLWVGDLVHSRKPLTFMYLKNLTVLGFKSFADRTSLNFQPGVTAIVGPNGCGKSNVSDAIRWVLGEQSAKALRGGEMADVIFNGTDSRKSLSMAEVSLTIGGVDDEHLSAAGVEIAYNEVTLTRRVFRDGSSEYYLNKTPCRLKDIQQLFMGTGVGRTSYSIMAQGNITQILSSKPEDRRHDF